jgi:hypothetical protein
MTLLGRVVGCALFVLVCVVGVYACSPTDSAWRTPTMGEYR